MTAEEAIACLRSISPVPDDGPDGAQFFAHHDGPGCRSRTVSGIPPLALSPDLGGRICLDFAYAHEF